MKRKNRMHRVATILFALLLFSAIFASMVSAENQINENQKPVLPRYIEKLDVNNSINVTPERDFTVHMDSDIGNIGRYVTWESESVTIPTTTLPYMYVASGLYWSSNGVSGWYLQGTAIDSGTSKSSVHASSGMTVNQGGYYITMGSHSFNGLDGTPYGPYQTSSQVIHVN